MTVTVGALTEREFFAWYALFSEYAAAEGVAATDESVMRVWTAVQAPGAIAAVARDGGGDVVGLVHALPFERLLRGDGGVQVEDLYVTGRSRRSGVASALVEHVLDRAEGARRALLRWDARLDDAAAHALQQKFSAASAGRVLQTLPVG